MKRKTDSVQDLKRDVFYRLLGMAGRVFVVVSHSEEADVGRRGFIGEEKEKGLVLVFNDKMKFDWDSGGICATLVFGSVPEKCRIPAKDIVSIYSPELNIQFVASQEEETGRRRGEDKAGDRALGPGPGNLIRPDFSRKCKGDGKSRNIGR